MTPLRATCEIWLYPGKAAWHFVTLPKNLSQEIKEVYGHLARGWGSLPVEVTIGKTTWKTSIFPDKKSDSYLLPIKSIVRKSERLDVGQKIRLLVSVLV